MRKLLIILAVVAALVVVGCSAYNDERGRGDAPVGEHYEAPRDVIFMPDQFPNLVVVCDGPDRLYVTTREAPPVVVQNSANCPEGGDTLQEMG